MQQTLSDGQDSTNYAISSPCISFNYLICPRAFWVCLLIFCNYNRSVQAQGFKNIGQSTSAGHRLQTGKRGWPVPCVYPVYGICTGMVPFITKVRPPTGDRLHITVSYEHAIKRIATTPQLEMDLPVFSRCQPVFID
jgi:hypothetical protein